MRMQFGKLLSGGYNFNQNSVASDKLYHNKHGGTWYAHADQIKVPQYLDLYNYV